jgi:hypothetical protein
MQGGRTIYRARAFIDLCDLQSALDRLAGRRFQIDWGAFGRWLAADAVEHAPGSTDDGRLRLDAIHIYRPRESMAPTETIAGERAVAVRATGVPGPQPGRPLILTTWVTAPGDCQACHLAGTGGCRRCRGEIPAPRQVGVTEAMVADLLCLTREGGLDLAVVVSEDNRLIPAVKFLRGRGKAIIHGWFPLRAVDLSRACDAFIDLGVHRSEFESVAA